MELFYLRKVSVLLTRLVVGGGVVVVLWHDVGRLWGSFLVSVTAGWVAWCVVSLVVSLLCVQFIRPLSVEGFVVVVD